MTISDSGILEPDFLQHLRVRDLGKKVAGRLGQHDVHLGPARMGLETLLRERRCYLLLLFALFSVWTDAGGVG